MVSKEDIRTTVDTIAREFNPERIVLFGSHARGTADADSDVDLLIVTPGTPQELQDLALTIYRRVRKRFPIDLLVRSPEELDFRIAHNDWFLREIMEQGIVMYESAHTGMAGKG